MKYNFCPQCGLELVAQDAHDDGLVPYCASCRRFWFDSFSTCIICMVVNEFNEIAMLKQNYLSDTYLNFVSGYIAPGETAEDAARREVREELGIEVSDLAYAGSYWYVPKELLMVGYIAHVKKAGFQLSSEVNSAEWIHRDDAPPLMHPESKGSCQQAIYHRWLQQTLNRHG